MVMVKFPDAPGHVTALLVNSGVTVMVAITGVWLLLLIPVKDGMFPEPFPKIPIPNVLFVQL